MQFSRAFLMALATALASAQNPFSFTTLSTVTAGTPFNITWSPSTGTSDTVSLILRQGSSTNLDTVQTIASGIQNTGSYLWTPPTSLVKGTGYAFEIVDDGNTNIVNYSGQFALDSTNTISSARSSASGASSSASASSASSASGSSGTAAVASTSSGASSSRSGSSSASATGSSSMSASRTGSSSSGSASATSSGSASRTSAAATSSPSALNAAGNLRVGVMGGLMIGVAGVMAAL